MNVQVDERLLTPSEVGELFGKSVVALAKMRVAGRGPRYVKIGARDIRYRESDILAYLDQQTFEQTAGTGR
ncbi:MAG: helix-turn-helix domain-containing protein [Salinibacterium sp.]|nr:helix-turn-helix domain-containing protein [Salinibacterium sp.]